MSCKILVISNNCLSRHNSNGRTLLNLLGGFLPEQIFQFYVANEVPSERTAAKFLRITDRDVIRSYPSFSKRVSLWEDRPKTVPAEASHGVGGYGKKTALKSLVRDLLWNTSGWVTRKLLAFARENGASVILLQAGDNVFLHRLARRVAKRSRLPLVIYNTEDYYFKDYDYMKRTMGAGLIYRAYHRAFCREFRKLIRASSTEVYNCGGLTELYNTALGREGKTVYGSTDFQPAESIAEDGLISYTGNLGCGRHEVLMRVAKALQELSPDLCLDVYGPADERIAADITACRGLRYHGFVSYGEVCRVIRDSRLLVHVESFDEYYRRDTRFAFSTKLADYGASHIPTFIAAPATSETYAYMVENEAAFVAASADKIKDTLAEALFDGAERERKRQRALALSKANHSVEVNGKLFKEILEGSIHDSSNREQD